MCSYAYETHNKRMLRAKKQIEREQILGQKMRKQQQQQQYGAGAGATDVHYAAAEAGAGSGSLSPGATNGAAPSANGSRYNTLFRDHINGLLGNNRNSVGAPVSAQDNFIPPTHATDPLRSGGDVGVINLNGPLTGSGVGDGGVPRSGAPSFNGAPAMDTMQAVPEFREHAASSPPSPDHSIRTRSHASANGMGAGGGGLPHSPNSNTVHQSPVHIHHSMHQEPQPLPQPIGVQDLSAAGVSQLASGGSVPAETSRSSNPARDRPTCPATTSSRSARSSPEHASARVIPRHVSFSDIDPSDAASAAMADSGPTAASNSASASLDLDVQLSSFGDSVVARPAASSPGPIPPPPTFHRDASSPNSVSTAPTLHALRPQAPLPVYVHRPKAQTEPSPTLQPQKPADDQPAAAATSPATAAIAGATPGSSPTFQFRFVGSASTQQSRQ